MSPANPSWPEFFVRLDGPEGVNAREVEGQHTWQCDHTLSKARAILADMGVDVDGSVAYFEDHGGFCDCEVLLNVDDREMVARTQAALGEE